MRLFDSAARHWQTIAMSKPDPLTRIVQRGMAAQKAADEAIAKTTLADEANVKKLRAQINAEVEEIKTRLADWLNRFDPHHTSPTNIALLETAFERALDTHEADAGEYINMVFHHVAQTRKNKLQ
jgi:hypothetical protein